MNDSDLLNDAPVNGQSVADSLMPLRGIIAAHNAQGVSHDLTTLRKWVRLNSVVYKTEKIDVILSKKEAHLWPSLSEFAEADHVKLSLRTATTCSIEAVQSVIQCDVYDVCLEHCSGDMSRLAAWLEYLAKQAVPVRVVLVANPASMQDVAGLVKILAKAASVIIAAYDPFIECVHAQDACESTEVVRQMNDLARKVAAAGVDCLLVGLPFCHVEKDNLSRALNTQQLFLDHNGYKQDSFVFAERMFRFNACRVSTAIENLLARRTSVHNLIDASLFPWIQDYPRLYIRTWMYHKLTRLVWFMKPHPRPLPENLSACEHELRRYRARELRKLGPVCASCRYKIVCDHDPASFRGAFPGIGIAAQEGEPLLAAPACIQARPRYYDDLDEARRALPERLDALAESARHRLMRSAPTREISADAYDILGRYTHHMPGAIRWLSFGKGELESTILAHIEPPFTLSFTVGGGIATHAGFSFGRHAKIICPLIDYSHRITLCVDADGYYVLLRDGQIVRPTEFESAAHLPARLGGVLKPRLDLHNIDGMILTQTVLLWEGAQPVLERVEEVKYSVIIISTRYTRRLQATLLALAHQQDISPQLFEVVIGYVPGIDATDDLMDSMEASFPNMRIVRSPFAEGRARAKGFMINESLRAASGKWVLLMDADILLPPDTFATLETIEEGCHFIAPDGRKMLPPHVTGQILLNELRPWEDYDQIMQGPGEIRRREADATPIGFFQCVRREILARIPYHELDHFEASDWLFGRDVTAMYGRERRMREFYVLHLDHGGSQWYGTHRHR